MAKFKIGQRVRIVKTGKAQQKFLGSEAIICSDLYYTPREGNEGGGPGFVYDCIIGSHKSFGPEWCFEPISKYDGNQVVSWEKCLWQPNHLKQNV